LIIKQESGWRRKSASERAAAGLPYSKDARRGRRPLQVQDEDSGIKLACGKRAAATRAMQGRVLQKNIMMNGAGC